MTSFRALRFIGWILPAGLALLLSGCTLWPFGAQPTPPAGAGPIPPPAPTVAHPATGQQPGQPGTPGAAGTPAAGTTGQTQSGALAPVAGGELAATPTTTPFSTPLPTAAPGATAVALSEELKGWIAYVGLDGDIWLMTPAGAGARRVISRPAAAGGAGATAARLQWSPSGQRLLYTVVPPAGSTAPATLFVWDAPHGTVTSLGPVAPNARVPTIPTGAWLPDSTLVAIARPDGTVAVRDVERGVEVVMGRGTDPAWVPPAGSCSAQGNLNNAIAVVRDNNIWLIDYPPHSGGEHQLTTYPAPGSAPWAVAGTAYLWNCQVLFFGDATGGLSAQLSGMGVYAVNLTTGQGQTAPLIERGGRVQELAVSPDGRYIGLTEDQPVNACIAAGDGRVYTIAGARVADMPLPLATQGYHAHMFGLSWGPRGDDSYVVAYNQNYCGSPDPGSLQSPIGSHLFLVSLNAPTTGTYIGDGSWPAWNGGVTGLGQAPDPRVAGH